MTEHELDNLKTMGCDIDYDPVFLSDEGYFDCLYTISYRGIFVGSDRSTFESVCKEIENIDRKRRVIW
jgi:hypothetical protein